MQRPKQSQSTAITVAFQEGAIITGETYKSKISRVAVFRGMGFLLYVDLPGRKGWFETFKHENVIVRESDGSLRSYNGEHPSKLGLIAGKEVTVRIPVALNRPHDIIVDAPPRTLTGKAKLAVLNASVSIREDLSFLYHAYIAP